jgi:small-conductance mechanosensitive channel
MLGRLLLLLLQVVVCWLVGPEIFKKLPNFGQLNIFAQAVVFAILVWLVGVVAAIVLKDVGQPSTAALTAALVVGLIFAAITLFPDATRAIGRVAKGLPLMAYPLIGAVAGYTFKR